VYWLLHAYSIFMSICRAVSSESAYMYSSRIFTTIGVPYKDIANFHISAGKLSCLGARVELVYARAKYSREGVRFLVVPLSPRE